jgi:hypothetical protein
MLSFFSWWKYLHVYWYNHMAGVCLNLWETTKLLSEGVVPFYSSTRSAWVLQFLLHPHQHLMWFYFIVGLIYVSLISNDWDHIFMCCLPSIYLFFAEITYWNLPIKKSSSARCQRRASNPSYLGGWHQDDQGLRSVLVTKFKRPYLK